MAGALATISFPHRMVRRPSLVTCPIFAKLSSHFSRILTSSLSSSSRIRRIILSCDSDIMISAGNMPGSRVWILLRSTSIPVPAFAAISASPHVRPPPPRSFIPRRIFASTASSIASMMSFLVKGSGTWTADRSVSDLSVSVLLAKLAPRMPSRPVLPPTR